MSYPVTKVRYRAAGAAKKLLPEIYLAVDDDQEEQGEDAVYDQVGVSQVNLIFGKFEILGVSFLDSV